MRVSAVIVKQNQVLLMHRKYGGREYFVFPGGSIEEGETSFQALHREIKEETNLKITSASEDSYYKDKKGQHNPIYYCEVNNVVAKISRLSPEAKRHSSNDWYHLEWYDIDNAIKLNKLFPKEGKNILRTIEKRLQK